MIPVPLLFTPGGIPNWELFVAQMLGKDIYVGPSLVTDVALVKFRYGQGHTIDAMISSTEYAGTPWDRLIREDVGSAIVSLAMRAET